MAWYLFLVGSGNSYETASGLRGLAFQVIVADSENCFQLSF